VAVDVPACALDKIKTPFEGILNEILAEPFHIFILGLFVEPKPDPT
jgi:hypothetical protein